MKLINISKNEQKVYPNVGQPFACGAGELTPELDPIVGTDLVESFPKTWAKTDGAPVPEIKPTKTSKKEI